jgi:hypothetical protein
LVLTFIKLKAKKPLIGINRTILELKSRSNPRERGARNSFNRTILELK